MPPLKLSSLSCLCLLLFASSGAAASIRSAGTDDHIPSVKLDHGIFRGATFLNGTVNRFLGIAYGESTALENRFRPPIPVAPYTGAQSATEYGPACPQQKLDALPNGLNFPESSVPPSEDCLTINVITPAGTKVGDRLPVVVFFYGGGFEVGSADTNDGSVMVAQSVQMRQPIIYVSMNSRQSAWGFLASREVQADGGANFSLLDQRLALKWVQKYIREFGGDPSKVTLYGESAGAISIGIHLVAKDGDDEHLFRGAIMQSGSPFDFKNVSSGQGIYDFVVQRAVCSDQKDTLGCLRSVPLETLQKAVDATPNLFSYQTLNLAFAPVVDGEFITDSPPKLVREGKMSKVPFISSDVDDEGTLFALPLLNITTDDEATNYWKVNFFPNITSSQLDRLAVLYPSNVTEGSPFGTGNANAITPQFKRLAAFLGDYQFLAPRRFLVNERPKSIKAWSSLNKRGKNTPTLGSAHNSDLAPVINGTSDLQVYLINFINMLNPNVGKKGSHSQFKLINWPEYTTDSKILLTAHDANATSGTPALSLTKDDFRKEALGFMSELEDQYY